MDMKQGVLKRDRQQLGEEFKQRYVEEVLFEFNTQNFAQKFSSDTTSIVLFCVEANPAACHRSLVAERLHQDWGVRVENL